jgi:sarcosine oxidase subunit alpha
VRPAEVIADGFAAGREAAAARGFGPMGDHRVPTDASPVEDPPEELTTVPAREPDAERRQFVDLGRDLTVADVRGAAGTGGRPSPRAGR